MNPNNDLAQLTKRIRHDILTITTSAGSGHPTSSLSAVEPMTQLFFGELFTYDFTNPKNPGNDHLVFSKGHASPLYYALYHMAGAISDEEMKGYRLFTSNLEGHPTPRFKYTEAATGSLGQGLSVGLGIAMGIKQGKTAGTTVPKVYVLLGDSELAEGQVWEAAQLASFYKMDNLWAIVDVNRLGQRGETMTSWSVEQIQARFASFGWEAIVVFNGHDLAETKRAYDKAKTTSGKPVAIIAKTIKGKGVSFLENKDGWHGKPLPQDMLSNAFQELGDVNMNIRGTVLIPPGVQNTQVDIATAAIDVQTPNYDMTQTRATREAYGDALAALGAVAPKMIVLDAETSNSTFAEVFAKQYPDRFREMYIAEQNMVSVAVGLDKMGYQPFISSFAAFFARGFDQIRMAQYSEAVIRVVGSHAGVSIGADGASQMGLEDIALMRSILESVVLYPSDAISTFKLAKKMLLHEGISYLRLTREKTPIVYQVTDDFVIGGSKLVRSSEQDRAVIIGAGITLHEAVKAHEELKGRGIMTTVLDTYSVKPIDATTIRTLVQKTPTLVVVEDHYPAGGIGDAVREVLAGLPYRMAHLCVRQIPRSGTPQELLSFEEIDATAIVEAVRKILN